MVTARSSPEDLRKGFEAGAFDYIEKPLSDVELVARVESALKTKLEMEKHKMKPTRAFKLIRDAMQVNDSKISLIDEIIAEISKLNIVGKEEIVRELKEIKEESLRHREMFEDILEGLI